MNLTDLRQILRNERISLIQQLAERGRNSPAVRQCRLLKTKLVDSCVIVANERGARVV